MAVRIAARMLDFIVGMSVVRHIDPEVYGANIHFTFMGVVSTYALKACFKKVYENRLFRDLPK